MIRTRNKEGKIVEVETVGMAQGEDVQTHTAEVNYKHRGGCASTADALQKDLLETMVTNDAEDTDLPNSQEVMKRPAASIADTEPTKGKRGKPTNAKLCSIKWP